jgi:hypothetical protein
MANAQQIEILKKGKVAWNNWRASNPDITPDLRNSNLNGMLLDGFNSTFAVNKNV